ncbi:dehydrogenase/reductase SDR family member 7-like [Oppia nitens]|uniref:dehydrogenase/reductase SDR family member 7-like n=1 Tax=Oppia nitens TaxID=1686743 RepID=UPI0023DA0DB7|nr:dehydrogenase/reductase SDR family member 7-like [Oppia nitens]
MWELLIGLALLTIVFLALTVWLLSRLDCDLQLVIYSKFGHSLHDLRGKVCWITGASSGIGEALAYVLATNGVKLVLSGTNRQRLDEVKSRCQTFGQLDPDDILVLDFDITNFDVHNHQLQEVLVHHKKLDILVLNAGRTQRSDFADIDMDVDKAMFDCNVFGHVSIARVVLRYFIANNITGAQFVVTSSAAAKLGAPNSASYTASKYALHGYFDCLRNEVHSRGIGVTIACPGPVQSRIQENMYTNRLGITVNRMADNSSSSDRMETSRCAYLMAIAAVNRLAEVWICDQPLLSLYYLNQYMPALAVRILPRLMSKKRVDRYREGTTGHHSEK